MLSKRKALIIFCFFSLIATLAGCSPNLTTESVPQSSDTPAPPTPTPVPTNLPAQNPVESFTPLDPIRGELPEGIAVDGSGNIYVSMGYPFWFPAEEGFGEIQKIGRDGESEVLASFPDGPAPAGMVISPFGDLFFAYPNPADPGTNGVYELGAGKEPRRLPGSENIGLANGLVLTPSHMYVSDSAFGAIWRIPRGGNAELWLQHELLAGCDPETDPVGANGIVVDQTAKAVYVANTSRGLLLRIPYQGQVPGEPEIIAGSNECDPEMDALDGMDGIVMSRDGSIYALLVMQNRLVKINPETGAYLVILDEEDGLHNPASIILGPQGKSLYITNYALLPPAPTASLGPGILQIPINDDWPEPVETVPPAPSPAVTPEATQSLYTEQISVAYSDRIIRGTLLGEGDIAVILAPMFDTPRGHWIKFARYLASIGYTAVAFDWPGLTGSSSGNFSYSLVGADTEAVYNFLRERGHERIFCMGASLGAEGCYQTALLHPEMAGFVVISGYAEATAEGATGLLMPKLLISGEEPDILEGLRAFFEVLLEPKQMEIIKTSAHGTDIFNTEKSDVLSDLLTGFLEAALEQD